MGPIVAVFNQKGGVGKTTTAINLAACLSDRGQKILLVDVDPQGNATSGFGIEVEDANVGLYQLLSGPEDDGSMELATVSRETSFANLRVLPSSPYLAGAEVELAVSATRDEIRRCLAPFVSQFDFVLLDTPPSLGILTVNSLVAAEFLIVPVQCEYYALEGLKHLHRTIELIRGGLNPQLRIIGLVRTMYDSRTLLSQQVAQELESHYPELVFRTIIPRTVRLSEAPSHGEPIIRYDPRSPGARAYRELAEEFLARFGKEAQPVAGVLPVVEPVTQPVAVTPTFISPPRVEEPVEERETKWQSNEDSVEDWLL